MSRIISGAARGRRLAIPTGSQTRPTSERVREALFSSVEAALDGLTGRVVLDLYAGSGALGLEALSRGAERVLLVESSPKAAHLVRANIDSVGLAGASLRRAGVTTALREPPERPADLVLIDPPYSAPEPELTGVLTSLLHGWLHPDSIVVIERSSRSPEPTWPPGMTPTRRRAYGETVLWFAQLTESVMNPNTLEVRRCVCPGSFDPVTNGHIDVIGRAAWLFDEVVVAVLINASKSAMFSTDERVAMIEESTKEIANVRVERFDGLLVDFCEAREIPAVVKGLRAAADFDYELQMAQMNRRIAAVETLFVPTSPAFSYLSSTLIKEVALQGRDVSDLIPPAALDRLVTRVDHLSQ
ncbi:MAG TPA: pantetheine-phosphate adenylyltransferase [Jiangellaceae bacterium]|nr:pantetheine-phosphate adenylyltransferase [Jiangellaceae bacterium]